MQCKLMRCNFNNQIDRLQETECCSRDLSLSTTSNSTGREIPLDRLRRNSARLNFQCHLPDTHHTTTNQTAWPLHQLRKITGVPQIPLSLGREQWEDKCQPPSFTALCKDLLTTFKLPGGAREHHRRKGWIPVKSNARYDSYLQGMPIYVCLQ